jgi:hypothetical protein
MSSSIGFEVGPDTPIRLEVAAREPFFPRGSMTAAILRKEGDRGNLDIMRIGGRLFTTANALKEMQRRCLLTPKDRTSSTSEPTREVAATGSSRTEESVSARASALHVAASLRQKLTRPSGNTSSQAGRSRERATVLPIRSSSRT